MGPTARSRSRLLLLLTGGPLAYGIFATWGAPALIRAVHSGQIPFVGGFLPGRATTSADAYIGVWEPLARSSLVVVLTVSLGVLLVRMLRSQFEHRRARPAATTVDLFVVALWIGIGAGIAEAYYYMSHVF